MRFEGPYILQMPQRTVGLIQQSWNICKHRNTRWKPVSLDECVGLFTEIWERKRGREVWGCSVNGIERLGLGGGSRKKETSIGPGGWYNAKEAAGESEATGSLWLNLPSSDPDWTDVYCHLELRLRAGFLHILITVWLFLVGFSVSAASIVLGDLSAPVFLMIWMRQNCQIHCWMEKEYVKRKWKVTRSFPEQSECRVRWELVHKEENWLKQVMKNVFRASCYSPSFQKP